MRELSALFGIYPLQYGVPLYVSTASHDMEQVLLETFIGPRRRALICNDMDVDEIDTVFIDVMRVPETTSHSIDPKLVDHYDVMWLAGDVSNLLDVCVRAARTRTFIITDGCYYWGGLRYGWMSCSFVEDHLVGIGATVPSPLLTCPQVVTEMDLFDNSITVDVAEHSLFADLDAFNADPAKFLFQHHHHVQHMLPGYFR